MICNDKPTYNFVLIHAKWFIPYPSFRVIRTVFNPMWIVIADRLIITIAQKQVKILVSLFFL